MYVLRVMKMSKQGFLSHLSWTGPDYSPLLLSLVPRLLLSVKGPDARSSYRIFRRGTAPLHTDAQVQLDTDPSHLSIMRAPPLSTWGQAGVCLLFVDRLKETWLFSPAVAPHESSLTPVGGDDWDDDVFFLFFFTV